MASNRTSVSTPSDMWLSNLEGLVREFGERGQSFDKVFTIRVSDGDFLEDVAQKELDILASRLVPFGKGDARVGADAHFQVTFKEMVRYGRSADVWFTLTVLPESEKPEPPKVPDAMSAEERTAKLMPSRGGL